ncbi:peroxiredoxin [soil metagenome]
MSKKSPKKMAKPAAKKSPVGKAKAGVRKVAANATKAAAKKPVPKTATPAAKSVAKAAVRTAATKPRGAPVAKAAIAPPTPKPVASKPAPAAKPAKPPRVAAAPVTAIEGARAPAFTLPRDGGALVGLADYHGKKLVIFFYPRANTPGCTREAIDFTRLLPDFAAAHTAVIGVSADPQKAQESFRDKHDLTIPLLSDNTHAMIDAYGAWGEKSMYGKAFLGIFRTTVLIDKDGTVAKIWRNVKVDGHAEEVLEEARRR